MRLSLGLGMGVLVSVLGACNDDSSSKSEGSLESRTADAANGVADAGPENAREVSDGGSEKASNDSDSTSSADSSASDGSTSPSDAGDAGSSDDERSADALDAGPDSGLVEGGTLVPDIERTTARDMSPDVPSEDRDRLAQDDAAFAWDLFARVAEPQSNVVFSPHSISTAMAMAFAGARAQTEDEIAEVMHYTLPQEQLHAAFNAVNLDLGSRFDDEEASLLVMSNALWGQKGFALEQPFLDTLGTHYGSGMFVLDFVNEPEGARGEINAWVSSQTQDKIPELLPPQSITGRTRLVLTNTINLVARWDHLFEEGATQTEAFSVEPNREVEVDMMHQTDSFEYASGEGVQVVRLPYDGARLGMWILLPEQGGLDELEVGMSAERFDGLVDAAEITDIDLSLPKFEFRMDLKLKEALSDMGMPTPFTKAADFSGITPEPIHLDDVYHDAFIAVDEQGTEAAAATAVVFGDGGAIFYENLVEFTVDHPFVFVIRDEPTGAILFVGRVYDPS